MIGEVISLCVAALLRTILQGGRVAEWLMAPVLKTGVPERVSGVRIPPLPPLIFPRGSKNQAVMILFGVMDIP